MNKQEVLKQCTVQGNIVKLPDYQLDRNIYLDVKKALELIGGTWKGGKTQGFIFQADPTEHLEKLQEGENINLKKEFQFFETPAKVAREMVMKAFDYNPPKKILEPSCGQGAIIAQMNILTSVIPDCYELMPLNRDILSKKNLYYNMLGEDFLHHVPEPVYSHIIANPPFTKGQDVLHLQHMYSCLAPNGILVCLTSTSWKTTAQAKYINFKKWLSNLEDYEERVLPEDSFKESGTSINVLELTIIKRKSEIKTTLF